MANTSDSIDRQFEDLIEQGFDEDEPNLIDHTEETLEGGLLPGQTPEWVAKNIGEFAHHIHGERGRDYFLQVIENCDNAEVKRNLAFGYIGVKAMSAADIDNID